MKRRDFLSLSGGLAGYAVFVRVDGSAGEPPNRDAMATAPAVGLRLRIDATCGDPIARVYEVRIYG